MDCQAIDDMYRDGRLVNLKVARGFGRATAAELVEQIVSAERQIADGTAVRITDIDNYSSSRSSL